MHILSIVTDEDYSITSMLTFNSSQINDCVNVDLLNDSSIEGCHSFTVILDALPPINVAGLTDIVIADENGELNLIILAIVNPQPYLLSGG